MGKLGMAFWHGIGVGWCGLHTCICTRGFAKNPHTRYPWGLFFGFVANIHNTWLLSGFRRKKNKEKIPHAVRLQGTHPIESTDTQRVDFPSQQVCMYEHDRGQVPIARKKPQGIGLQHPHYPHDEWASAALYSLSYLVLSLHIVDPQSDENQQPLHLRAHSRVRFWK